MAKTKDIVLENLKGFVRKGASSNSPGNVPTGHFNLDFVIHYGTTPDQVDLNQMEDYDPAKPLGFPLGKLIEVYGEEGGGKSSIGYRVIGAGQKMGYLGAWIDTENSFSDNLALINGVDRDELYYADMSSDEDLDRVFFAEDVFDAIIALIQSGVKIIVLDSVANLVPKDRMEAEASKATVASVARLMSQNLGKIVNYAGRYGAAVIFINQLREKIGIMFGNPETTPGGRSLKHNASLRIQISKKGGKDANIYIEDEDDKEKLIGRFARINIRKNRMAKPFFESLTIPIYYEPYFPDIEERLFDVGRQLKIISVRKGIFKWVESDSQTWQVEGRKAFIGNIKTEGLEFKLANAVMQKAEEVGVFVPPEITQWHMQNTKVDKKVSGAKDSSNAGPSTRGRKRKNSADGVVDAPAKV